MNELKREFNSTQVNLRFNRDAKVFEGIYNENEKGFNKWFNKQFRKPVYERYDVALKTIGDASNKKVIDIGCGTGIYMVAAAHQGASRILGVDLCENMLAFTAKKVKERKLESICELMRANFLEMELKEKFHFSLAMGVFDYLPDPINFMHRLKQVTTEKVIASFPGHSLIRKPLRKLRYALTSRGTVYFYNKKDIERIVQAVGFKEYQINPMKTGSGFMLIATP